MVTITPTEFQIRDREGSKVSIPLEELGTLHREIGEFLDKFSFSSTRLESLQNSNTSIEIPKEEEQTREETSNEKEITNSATMVRKKKINYGISEERLENIWQKVKKCLSEDEEKSVNSLIREAHEKHELPTPGQQEIPAIRQYIETKPEIFKVKSATGKMVRYMKNTAKVRSRMGNQEDDNNDNNKQSSRALFVHAEA